MKPLGVHGLDHIGLAMTTSSWFAEVTVVLCQCDTLVLSLCIMHGIYGDCV